LAVTVTEDDKQRRLVLSSGFVVFSGVSSRSRSPQRSVEVANPRSRDGDTLGCEKGALEELAAAVAAKAPAGRDHAVARHVASAAVAHDVPHCARGTRTSGELGDVAVRRDAPGRNAPDSGQHTIFE
jgi:hypothetical protein